MNTLKKLSDLINLKSFGISLAVIITVFALVFSGFIRNGGSLGQHIAAKVGSQLIPMQKLRGFEKKNVKQGLQQLIEQKVIIEEGFKMNFVASDTEVADWIKKSFVDKDKKFDKAAYQKYLKSTQELELFKQGRDAIITQKVLKIIGLVPPLPDVILEEKAKRDSVKFYLEWASVELLNFDKKDKDNDKKQEEFILALEKSLVSQDIKQVNQILSQHGKKWEKLKEPVTATSLFIPELGLSKNLLRYVFALKKPSDFIPTLIDFGGQRAIVRLVQKTDSPQDKEKASTEYSKFLSNDTFTNFQKTWIDIYEKTGQIKRNSSLFSES